MAGLSPSENQKTELEYLLTKCDARRGDFRWTGDLRAKVAWTPLTIVFSIGALLADSGDFDIERFKRIYIGVAILLVLLDLLLANHQRTHLLKAAKYADLARPFVLARHRRPEVRSAWGLEWQDRFQAKFPGAFPFIMTGAFALFCLLLGLALNSFGPAKANSQVERKIAFDNGGSTPGADGAAMIKDMAREWCQMRMDGHAVRVFFVGSADHHDFDTRTDANSQLARDRAEAVRESFVGHIPDEIEPRDTLVLTKGVGSLADTLDPLMGFPPDRSVTVILRPYAGERPTGNAAEKLRECAAG